MAMVFQFRMLSDEDDAFFRDYVVPYDMTLLDFHNFICKQLKFDNENMTSFFTSDKEWNKLREFTLMDMGLADGPEENAPVPMESTLLSQVIAHNFDRLIYQFDMLEERALYLELTGAIKSEPGKLYPFVLAENGPAPDQFDPSASVGGSIFDEAMEDFGEFAEDEGYDCDE